MCYAQLIKKEIRVTIYPYSSAIIYAIPVCINASFITVYFLHACKINDVWDYPWKGFQKTRQS